jgi:hypothetical protein
MSDGFDSPFATQGGAARVDYRLWFWRVISWDTTLLLLVWSVPGAIELLLPNNPEAMLVAAVLVPIAAFVFRIYAGRRQIAQNHGTQFMRTVQFIVFLVGIFMLMMIDCILIVLCEVGLSFVERAAVYLVASPTYLAPMAIAMYPGPTVRSARPSASE